MITIIGATGKILNVDQCLKKIENVSTEHNIVIQIFNAETIYDEIHLRSAAEHAIRSFIQKTNTTNTLAMETVLYASGERQIQKAIKKIGVKKTANSHAFLFIGEIQEIGDASGKISKQFIQEVLTTLDLTRKDEVLKGDIDTLHRFGISDKELISVPEEHYGDLILEKIALVDIIK